MIRNEIPDDVSAIRRVVAEAFGRTNEARLVDALRQSGGMTLSLVALEKTEIVGHIAFSPVTVESQNTTFDARALAPLAVLPAYQRRGIGSELVRRGLEACGSAGHAVVIVLGHPAYYRRFGFATASLYGLLCPFEVPNEAFMVAELTPGALKGRSGTVRYRPEFDAVSP